MDNPLEGEKTSTRSVLLQLLPLIDPHTLVQSEDVESTPWAPAGDGVALDLSFVLSSLLLLPWLRLPWELLALAAGGLA